MQDHYSFSDLEFEEQFAACSFPPEAFSHEAHLRLAWIHIERYGVVQAEKHIVQQLQRYVVHLGAQDKFNMTLTVAAIKAVYHFKTKATSTIFNDFIHEFPRLKTDFKVLMACHYSKDIYRSKTAKKRFLKPDVLPFD